MNTAKLDELAALAEKVERSAVTPGPWYALIDDYGEAGVRAGSLFLTSEPNGKQTPLAQGMPDGIGRYVETLDPPTVRELVEAARLRVALADAYLALPESWELELKVGSFGRIDLWTASATYCYSLKHYRANVGPARSVPFEMAHNADPVIAVTSLTAALRERAS